MEPRIITIEAFAIIGIWARFDPTQPGFFDDLWMRQFMAKESQVKPLSCDQAYYGVYFHGDASDEIEYLAGMAVKDITIVPPGFTVRQVSAARYVVHACTVKDIGAAAEYMFSQWLPASSYEYDNPRPDFEYYPPDTIAGDSPVLIYIPVKERGARQED